MLSHLLPAVCDNYCCDGCAGPASCTPCKTCAAQATSTNACAAGLTADSSQCTCNAGWYGPGTSCTQCPAGSYSAAGATACTLCSPGTYASYDPATNLARSCSPAPQCPTTQISTYNDWGDYSRFVSSWCNNGDWGGTSTSHGCDTAYNRDCWWGVDFGGARVVVGGKLLPKQKPNVLQYEVWVGSAALTAGTQWSTTGLQLCFTYVLSLYGCTNGMPQLGPKEFSCSVPVSGRYHSMLTSTSQPTSTI